MPEPVSLIFNAVGNAVTYIEQLNINLGNMPSAAGQANSALNVFKGTLAALGVQMSAAQLVRTTTEIIDQGKAWQTARASVEATVGSYEGAVGAINDAQAATGGLTSKIESAQAVNVFLRNGLAQTGAEAGKMAQAGAVLSDVYEAQGASFEKYIRFISSGSPMLFDNFGLTKAQADALSEQIQQTEGLTKAQADVQARIRLTNDAAQDYLDTMPESVRVNKEFAAAMSDFGAALGEKLLPLLTETEKRIVDLNKVANEETNLRAKLAAEVASGTKTRAEANDELYKSQAAYARGRKDLTDLTDAEIQSAQASVAVAQGFNDVGAALATMHVPAQKAYEDLAALAVISEKSDAYAKWAEETSKKSEAAIKANEDIESAEIAHASKMEDIRRRLNDRLESLNEQQANADISHARTVADLQAQIADIGAGQIERRQEQLNRSLENLAQQHKDRVASIRQQMDELEYNYTQDSASRAEKNADKSEELEYNHNQRVADLEQQIGEERTVAGMRRLQQQLERENLDYEHRKAVLAEQVAEEDVEAKKKHDHQLQLLKERLDEENREYKRQKDQQKKLADEEMANIRQQNAERLAGLEQRLARENEDYARLNEQREKDRQKALSDSARAEREEMKRFGEIIKALQEIVKAYNDIGIAQSRVSGTHFDPYRPTTHVPGAGYAQGTNYVPEDQLAFLHKGEAVIPAEYNTGARGPVIVNLNFNSPVLSLTDQYQLENWLKPAINQGVRQALMGG